MVLRASKFSSGKINFEKRNDNFACPSLRLRGSTAPSLKPLAIFSSYKINATLQKKPALSSVQYNKVQYW